MNIGNPLPASAQRLFFRIWRPGVLVLGLLLIVYLLYFRHLGTLLPGYNTAELQAYTQSANWHNIASNPVNAPYSILVWFLTAVLHHHLLATRIISACFGTLAMVAFFFIIRPWYSFRIASLGTLLFATSAGFLHVARLGTPQILQMGVLALLAIAVWYRRSRHRTPVGYIALGLCALLWYIPGMVWFELLGCALVWRSLWGQVRRTTQPHRAGAAAAFVAVLAPLVVASIRDPHVLLVASGLPAGMDVARHIGINLWHTVTAIGIRGRGDPLQWVGRAALLSATERVLAALGLYVYLYRERSMRAIFLASSAAIAVTLISFGNGVGFATIIPLLYLAIVHGLDHLLGRWFAVFPRNPIARITGVSVVCIMLAFSIFYQARVYFIAWPHNAATRQAFSLPPS